MMDLETVKTGQAVAVEGYRGVAFRVTGLETAPDEDTHWTGIEPETGRVECVMVGDDRVHAVEPDELTLIDEDDFCPGCGQTGCRAYEGYV